MPHKIWLRVNLPDKDLAALQQDFPNCEFYGRFREVPGRSLGSEFRVGPTGVPGFRVGPRQVIDLLM